MKNITITVMISQEGAAIYELLEKCSAKCAEKLNINYETLRSRIKEIYRKLGAQNKLEAVMTARNANLI